jgi:hypothetical protein
VFLLELFGDICMYLYLHFVKSPLMCWQEMIVQSWTFLINLPSWSIIRWKWRLCSCCILTSIIYASQKLLYNGRLHLEELQQWCNDSMLASTAVDHVFEPQFDQTKDYIFGICCFSIKHATLKSKSRVNHNNVSEWSVYL